jgi:hypothetical protein
LRSPEPGSADERRARLDRFSAGKATAQEVMALGDAADAGELGAEFEQLDAELGADLDAELDGKPNGGDARSEAG